MSLTRRHFLAGSAAAVASTRYRPRVAAPPAARLVLFQGDSITDVGRDRAHDDANDQRGLGGGYPLLCAAAMRDLDAARDLQVFNRGVSGNTVTDLQARWDHDTLALRPDVLSILIGVNDIWHTLGKTPAAEVVSGYESGYTALLGDTRRALPNVQLVVLEPFVLHTGAVTDAWFPEFDQLRSACRRVADHAGARFVALHEMFQRRAAKTSPAYWASDGVHPTPAGHEAIADAWASAVKS